MTHKNSLYRLRKDMAESFQAIKSNPMDLNRIMEHLGKVSSAVDLLIDESLGSNYMFDQHMKMLGTVPEGYPRQQVSIVQHWRDLGLTIKAGDGVDLSEIHPDDLLFWSDQHFGHKKIIEYSNRPFADLPHMHAEMAKRYKMTTKPGQVVVWCGDVSFMGITELRELMKDYASTYNVLIVGNHDIEREGTMRNLGEFFDEIHTSLVFGNYVITHHPWVNMLPDGMINIHGHLHDRPFSMKDHLCACVELTGFAPVSLTHLIRKGERDDLARLIASVRAPQPRTFSDNDPEASMDYYKSVAHQFIEPKK